MYTDTNNDDVKPNNLVWGRLYRVTRKDKIGQQQMGMKATIFSRALVVAFIIYILSHIRAA